MYFIFCAFVFADGVMKEFYAAVENNRGKEGGPDGALFLAVCRGKGRCRTHLFSPAGEVFRIVVNEPDRQSRTVHMDPDLA